MERTRGILIGLTLLTVAPACGPKPASPGAQAPPVRAQTAAPPAQVPPGGSCDTLSRTACMQSPACTLVLEPPDGSAPSSRGRYTCRDAEGSCEEGLAQWELPGGGGHATSDKECSSRPGCELIPGECYCACRGYGRTAVEDGPEANGCLCVCAGGPPPQCAAKT